MTDAEELAYERGSRAAWLSIFRTALTELGRDSEEWNAKRWIAEREAAIASLRRICEEFGDNDWPDDLHLSDIIEKHLEPYLE